MLIYVVFSCDTFDCAENSGKALKSSINPFVYVQITLVVFSFPER